LFLLLLLLLQVLGRDIAGVVEEADESSKVSSCLIEALIYTQIPYAVTGLGYFTTPFGNNL
jgi:hypothetical protein